MALMFTPEHFRMTPVIRFVKTPFQTIGHVHRFGYRLLVTARLAQDVKQLVSILITHGIVQQLGPALA